MIRKILDGEVEVAASNHVVYLTVLERFFRVGCDMVTTENSLRVWTDPFDIGDAFPVTLYHRSLRLYRNQIGSLLGYLVQPLVVGFLLRNRIVPFGFIPRNLQHSGRRRRNHRVNVSGLVEILELP